MWKCKQSKCNIIIKISPPRLRKPFFSPLTEFRNLEHQSSRRSITSRGDVRCVDNWNGIERFFVFVFESLRKLRDNFRQQFHFSFPPSRPIRVNALTDTHKSQQSQTPNKHSETVFVFLFCTHIERRRKRNAAFGFAEKCCLFRFCGTR